MTNTNTENDYILASQNFIKILQSELDSVQAGKVSGVIKWDSISPGETSEIADVADIVSSLTSKCKTAISYLTILSGALKDTISSEVSNVLKISKFQEEIRPLRILKQKNEKMETEYLEKLCKIEALAYDGYYKQINIYNCPPNCTCKELEEHLKKFNLKAEKIDIASFTDNNNIPLTAAVTFKNCLEAFEARKKLSQTYLNEYYIRVKQTYYYSPLVDSMEQLQIVDYSDDEYEYDDY